jgi:ABC-type oligopeptide transport system substrate-binding subunit
MRRLRLLGACVLATTVVLGATRCGQGGQTQSQSLAADQTIRFAISDDVGWLDPAQVYASADLQIAQNLFDGLVRYDNSLNVVPELAVNLPTISPDQLTYTFKLRPDATFSNGDRVTSRDVMYSLNRAAAAQGPYAGDLSAVAGFDKLSVQPPAPDKLEQLLAKGDPSVRLTGLSAPDDTTVVVKLVHPAGSLLSALALPGAIGMIVDQKVIQKDPQGWWTKPDTLIGTGPYRMSARTPGQALDFQAIANWWGTPQPTVKKVHLDVIPDAGAREARYEQGQYDLNGFGGSSVLGRQDLARIKTTDLAKQLTLRPGIASTWVSFNLVHDAARVAGGPFLDSLGQPARDLRLAFTLAVDKAKLALAVCGGVLCTPATGGLVPRGLKGYGGDNSDPLAAFDAARARTLLKSADPTGSQTRGLSFAYDAESSLFEAVAKNLRQQWETNLGVRVELQPVAHQQLVVDARSGKFVLNRAGWQAHIDHPMDWYDNLFGKVAGCPDANCNSGYDNAQFDQLAAQANAKALAEALPLYQQLAQMLSTETAYIPLFYSTRTYMIKPYVRGAGANNLLEFAWDGYQILQH